MNLLSLERGILRHVLETQPPMDILDRIAKLPISVIYMNLINEAIEGTIDQDDPLIKGLKAVSIWEFSIMLELLEQYEDHLLKQELFRIMDNTKANLDRALNLDDGLWQIKQFIEKRAIIEDPAAWSPQSDIFASTKDQIRKIKAGEIKPFKSGIPWFDKAMKIKPGDLITIASRPGIGKTSLSLYLSIKMGVGNRKVGFLELEMFPEALGMRQISALSGIKLDDLQSENQFTDEQKQTLSFIYNKYNESAVHYCTSAGMKWEQIKRQVGWLKRTKDIDIVFFDNMSLIKSERKMDRLQELTMITSEMKELAMSLGIVCVPIVHMNRKIEERGKKATPSMADLRESGSIEQDSDTIIFLVGRDEDFDSDTLEVDFFIAKARHGRTGIKKLNFKKATQQWQERIS